MDIQIFDDFEDGGQLTLFGLEEDYEELRTSVGETVKEPTEKETAVKEPMRGKTAADLGIRIRSCSSCGKLLFVREEDGGYVSACNACGIQYIQR